MLDILLCPARADAERDWDAYDYKLDRYHQETIIGCYWCDRPLLWEEATVDHIVPRWRGGRSQADNLEITCKRCNDRRGVVSALASRFRSIYQNPRGRSMDRRRALLVRALKERDEHLELLLEVESMYYRRLDRQDPRQRSCLRELDEVLRAGLGKL